MADPITAFGAAAGTVQIADVALRLGRQLYTFLGQLRSARQDIGRLQDVLLETDDLIRNIVAYIIEWRTSPRTRLEHRELPPSLVRTVEWFAQDMELLRKHLPKTLSLAFVDRVKFVIRRDAMEEVTSRLVERKQGASLALGIIGRRTDLAVLNDLGSMRTALDDVRDSIASVRQQQTTTLTVIRDLSTDHLQTGEPALTRLNELQATSSTHRSAITTRLEFLISAQANSTRSITSGIISADRDQLSRIVRAELKHALEPFLQRIGGQLDSIIDCLALYVSGSPEAGPAATMSTAMSVPSRVHSPAGLSHPDDASDATAGEANRRVAVPMRGQTRRVAIRLSRVRHWYKSRFGELVVCVERFRTTSSSIAILPREYFRVQVDFLPAAWISSHGLSVMYSSGPDIFGYYSICPQILPFTIIPNGAEVWGVIACDSVLRFRQMLDSGEVSLRSQNPSWTILEFAVANGAHGITDFLVNSLNLECNVLDSSKTILAASHMGILQIMRSHSPRALFKSLTIVMDHVEVTYNLHPELAPLEHARLSDPDTKAIEYLQEIESLQQGSDILWAFPTYCFRHFKRIFPRPDNLAEERWLLDLFLQRGGNPNLRGPLFRQLPLEAALELTTCSIPSGLPKLEEFLIEGFRTQWGGRIPGVDSEDVLRFPYPVAYRYQQAFAKRGQMPRNYHDLLHAVFYNSDDAWKLSDEVYGPAQREESFQDNQDTTGGRGDGEDAGKGLNPFVLLRPLIEAGADVHAIVEYPDGEPLGSLSQYATWLGLEDIWDAALEEAGYCPYEVWEESERRMAEWDKGCSSAVDSGILRRPDDSGLRYRGRIVEEE